MASRKGRKRVRWSPGAVYAVPLSDGSFGIAQAIDAMMVNVIYVALFAHRFAELPTTLPLLQRNHIVSLTATWRQHLNRGDWPYLEHAPLSVAKSSFPNERFARDGYVGAKHADAGILALFLSAYHGLVPWNVMYRDDYYDQFLAPGVPRPTQAVILDHAARAAYQATHFPKPQVK
jgi:immunity protein 26 of polymorphic toxin system